MKSLWIKFRRSNFVLNILAKIFKVFSLFPPKKNLIIFESFHGKQYSDNPRAIYEYLVKNRKNTYKMYWSVDKNYIHVFSNRKEVKYVKKFSIKWFYLCARAEFWVVNTRLPLWVPKPKHTTYVQTWHGTPLKRLGVDIEEVHMPGTNTERYKRNFVNEAKKWDYLISPNAYSTEIFKRAFQFKNKMIETGYPRNDFLINYNNEETILKIKEKTSIPTDKKIILYAPTWRDNQYYSKGKYKFDLQIDIDLLKRRLGENYFLILRLHYLVAEQLDLSGHEDFVLDLSSHEDIRELYLVSDILITDYSSVFFDYAILKRPMIFFTYDIEEYRDQLRGFYFDFENKAPGPLVKNTDEIINEILSIEEKGFKPTTNVENFYKKFCYLEDGKASKRVVEYIFDKN